MRFITTCTLFVNLFTLLICASATQEVITPRVRVLFENAALEPYAQRVANEAERALDVLVPLFDFTPQTITLTIDPTTDVYNATAFALPRPKVALRALFPNDVNLGYRTQDDLTLLLLHELTHNVQLSYDVNADGARDGIAGLPRLGIVGENLAAVPPLWLIEGLAVWVESEFTTGGRLGDALTTGLVRSAALGEHPSLADVSLFTYSAWPGGTARYLYGAEFIGYLVEQHGFEAILETLRVYNSGEFFVPFAEAWRQAVGTDLSAEWQAWWASVEAVAETKEVNTHAGRTLTETDWYTRAPALNRNETQLAWVSWPPSIKVADFANGELTNERELIRDRSPSTLAWLGARTLLYARPVRRPGSEFSELFTLDVLTGQETQLTSGARAQFPEPTPEGCILYVHDIITEPSQVRRWCNGETEILWRAPNSEHVVGLTVSEAGRVALSVWREGFVDLAVLEGGRLRYLTQDAAQDLDPTWRGETVLEFRSDRGRGEYELYRLELSSQSLTRLTETVGGAFSPEVTQDGLLYAQLGAKGYNLAFLDNSLEIPIELTRESLLEVEKTAQIYPIRNYAPLPSLAPYGWLPTGGELSFSPFGLAASAAVLGQDDSGAHSYALSLGFDSALAGAPLGLFTNLRYAYGAGGLLEAQQPLSFGVRAGLWPHNPHLGSTKEVALGVMGDVSARLPLDQWTLLLGSRAGTLRLPSRGDLQFDGRVDAALSKLRSDPWGYRVRGLRLGASGVWSATPEGPSLGVWADAVYFTPFWDGTLELSGRSGYRPGKVIPVESDTDLSTLFTVGYRRTLPLALRYGDGLYAAERVSLEPRLRTWLDSSLHLGADLTISLDTVINYGAPTSIGATLGYADGFWYRLGLRLPL